MKVLRPDAESNAHKQSSSCIQGLIRDFFTVGAITVHQKRFMQ